MTKYLRTGVKVEVLANISDNVFLVCLWVQFSVLGSSPGLGSCTNGAGACLSPSPVILESRMSSWALLSDELRGFAMWKSPAPKSSSPGTQEPLLSLSQSCEMWLVDILVSSRMNSFLLGFLGLRGY